MIKTDARVFRELIDRVKPDAVYLPTADQEAQSLALSRLALRRSGLSRIHCEALLIRVPAAYGMSPRPPFVTKMALRAMPFDVVHYIDPVAFDWVLNNVGGKAGRSARFIADPIEPLSLPTRSQARAMLGLPEHKKLIMSIGMQDHRKGVDYLIGACARWQPAEPASIVLAGMLSAQIKELVTKRIPTSRGRWAANRFGPISEQRGHKRLLRGGRPDRDPVSASSTSIRHRASRR